MDIWLERKKKFLTGSIIECDDLIGIMLQDTMFRDNDESSVDEILTIFFAGTQTSANTT